MPSLPADAGALQILATDSLALHGTINFATGSFVSGTDSSGHPITQQGAGGDVSIQAPNIQVVDSATNVPAVPVRCRWMHNSSTAWVRRR